MNTDTLTIRKAEPADAPLVLWFIKKIAEYEKLSHLVTANEESLTRHLLSPGSTAEALLAYIEDTPVAYAIYFHNFSSFTGKAGLYLEDIFVLPEYRSKGIGKELFRHVARIADERDCFRMEWVVLDWNRSAIDFYKALGAEDLSDWNVFRLSGDDLKNVAAK